MALHLNQFQQQYYQNQSSNSHAFRIVQTIDGQNSQPVAYSNPNDLRDQSQHPPFHVVGFAPGPIPIADGSDAALDMQWNYGFEPKSKKLKEQDFLEDNCQISVDFLPPPSVSTGLGLSLDYNRGASTGESTLLSLIAADVDSELQRQDAEIERFLKVQGDRLRLNILEKIQTTQLQSLSLVEEKVMDKLRDKEEQIESINKKNMDLEEQIEQLKVEAETWQQRARCNENMIAALKFNLQQVFVQARESKEDCGDGEVDDKASGCNCRSIDFDLLYKNNDRMKDMITCKACKVKEVCTLLLPCKHLCLCKECESKLSCCPVCQSSKAIGMEIYM